MEILKENFGKTNEGLDVSLFTLSNSSMKVKIINYGGIIVSLLVPDKTGKLIDVVLGYDSMEQYSKNTPYFGALIGRFCNRIKSGKFLIDGVEYQVALNDNGINHLHGGIKGFNAKLWNAEIIEKGLELTYFSKDGEENYPGNVNVKVIYSLSDDNELKIEYFAVSDKATLINLTNHSYFNINGHNSGNVLNQKVWIDADSFTRTDETSIPTGEFTNVKGTPFDFTTETNIGARINNNYDQLQWARGYDHNFVLNKNKDELKKVASVYSDETEIVMEVSTTSLGLQLYTANYLNGDLGKEKAVYNKNQAVCFETQYFPNCINIPQFESCLFKANEEYNHTTIYKFSLRKN